MTRRVLGRTGLPVSIMGMGSGGYDPLGAASGRPDADMVRLLRRAFDLGINVFDTSPDYGGGRSERLIGEALQELPRDQVVVSTKLPLAVAPPGIPVVPARPEALAPAVESSLKRLRTDYVDVLLAAVADLPEHFGTVVEDLFPVLDRLRRQGKVRFLGSSEQTRSDGAHLWLRHLLPADLADVVMVGHNLINQSAQRSLFPACRRQDVGVLNIFTVRRVFRSAERVRQVIDELRRDGLLDAPLPADDPPRLAHRRRRLRVASGGGLPLRGIHARGDHGDVRDRRCAQARPHRPIDRARAAGRRAHRTAGANIRPCGSTRRRLRLESLSIS